MHRDRRRWGRIAPGPRTSARRSIAVASLAAAIVLMTAAPPIAAAPVAVVARPHVFEYEGSASLGYFVWVANSPDHARHFNAYARPDGGQRVRLNPVGTQSTDASVDATTAVYSQWGDNERDLWLYNLTTGDRTDPGPGVNTPQDESRPGISGNYLFFSRARVGSSRIKLVLYDMVTGTQQVVAAGPSLLISMQVSGDWAVWDRCHQTPDYQYKDCNVFRYRISTGETFQVPNPGKQQYSSAVTSDGTVYFARTATTEAWHCGQNVRLFRYPVGGPAHLVASLPPGDDLFSAFAFEDAGAVTLYLNREVCSSNERDIYKIEGADSA